jgi:phenylacetate-CoA ligase
LAPAAPPFSAGDHDGGRLPAGFPPVMPPAAGETDETTGTGRRSFAEWLREAGLAHHQLSPSHYERLPSPLQDVLCSAHGLVYARRRGRGASAAARDREVDALHWDAGRSRALVERRARRILDLARTLPGYAGAAPSPNGGSALEELSRWPALGKDRVRSRPEQFLTRTPGGTDIFAVTSGTTGTPVKVWRTLESYREVVCSRDLVERWFLTERRLRRAAFTYRMIVPAPARRVWRMNLPELHVVLSSYHISAENLPSYERVLTRWRPQILDGAASELVELAALLRERGLRPHVPLVVSSSEMLPPSGRSLIRSVFGGAVTDVYGTSEEIALAGECPAGSRHIFPNVGVIEAVDDDGRAVPPGCAGRLLLTTLTNDLMPLVRFDIGDVGSVGDPGSCPCGRTSPVLRELHGREDDVVVTTDGRRISIFAFSLALHRDDLVALQLVQRQPDDFLVRARLTGTGADRRASFEEAVTLDIDRLLGPDPGRTVDFRYDEVIEKTPGGKIRNVIREF